MLQLGTNHRCCQQPLAHPYTATPLATTLSQHLPHAFFARPAEVVAPELIGCLLVKRQPTGELLWGVIVETEASTSLAEVGRRRPAAPPGTAAAEEK